MSDEFDDLLDDNIDDFGEPSHSDDTKNEKLTFGISDPDSEQDLTIQTDEQLEPSVEEEVEQENNTPVDEPKVWTPKREVFEDLEEPDEAAESEIVEEQEQPEDSEEFEVKTWAPKAESFDIPEEDQNGDDDETEIEADYEIEEADGEESEVEKELEKSAEEETQDASEEVEPAPEEIKAESLEDLESEDEQEIEAIENETSSIIENSAEEESEAADEQAQETHVELELTPIIEEEFITGSEYEQGDNKENSEAIEEHKQETAAEQESALDEAEEEEVTAETEAAKEPEAETETESDIVDSESEVSVEPEQEKEEPSEAVTSPSEAPSKSVRTKKSMETIDTSNAGDGTEDGVILKSISKVMHESMIPYSEFVIMDRALPRVEDGLKPVQRRILYAMNDMGLTPDKPFRKSAGIVGECLGKYHPHGDTSVYDAMVRLAQPFNMNMPLVLGQGNFGSEDGDPPAAMRYTEAKLNHLALELLRDIEKETVPFSLTFDDRNTEPDILPGRYPNLLVNGATGIAVGLATNIAPHNLAEVIDAHVAYIDNPKLTLAQAMKIIKGPDFPTGGFVIVGEDLHTAYKTGKGKVIMRAKIHIEVESNDKRNIVITELPYQVNKVVLQKNIADLRESKKGALSGISEIRDESDRKGMRVVIKVKRESDPKAICDMLFKYTNLQCNFNINMVAIANGKPKLMGLLELIAYYVNYQREVIYKRCVFDLENAKERAHILEGLLIAIRNIDEVVRIIKTSKHTTEARQRLRDTFELSERQAQAILDLRLARLTSLEVFKLEEELEELKKLIDKLEKIIASKQLQFDVVKTELLEIKKKHKIDRRSRIIGSLEDAVITADDDEKPVEDIVVTVTAEGTLKRMPVKHFSMSKTEANSGLGLHDVNTVVLQTQTDKMLYIFTNIGNCYKLEAGDVPDCKLRDKGTSFKTIFNIAAEGELPIAIYALPQDYLPSAATEGEPSDGNSVKLSPELVWLTRMGMIKRSSWTESCGVVKSVFQCYKSSRSEDAVLRVDEFKPGCTVMLITSSGMMLHAQTGDVPLQGRIAGGVKGISMTDDDFVVCNVVAKKNGFIVAVTSKGNVKRVDVKKIDKMVRYRKGVMLGALDKDERIVFASVVKGDEDLVAQLENGTVVFTPVDKIPVTDRTGKYKSFPGSKGKIKAAWIHRRKKNN